jgi:hypothetical protein
MKSHQRAIIEKGPWLMYPAMSVGGGGHVHVSVYIDLRVREGDRPTEPFIRPLSNWQICRGAQI